MDYYKETDQFVVNRDDTTFTVPVEQLVANDTTLEDTDLFLINRDDTTYTTPWETIKDELGSASGGVITRPEVIQPVNFSGISERLVLDPIYSVKSTGIKFDDYITGGTNGGGHTSPISGFSRQGDIFDPDLYPDDIEPPVSLKNSLYRVYPYGDMTYTFYIADNLDPDTGTPINNDSAGIPVQNELVIQFYQGSPGEGFETEYRINNETAQPLFYIPSYDPDYDENLIRETNRIVRTGPMTLKTLNLRAWASRGGGVYYIYVDGKYLEDDYDPSIELTLSGNTNFNFLSAGTQLVVLESASSTDVAATLEVTGINLPESKLECTRITGRLPVAFDVLLGESITPGAPVNPDYVEITATDFESIPVGIEHISTDWLVYKGTGETVFSNNEDEVNLTTWNVSGLDYDTVYKIQVRYRGPRNNLSDWSEPATFRTASTSYQTSFNFGSVTYTGNGTVQQIDTGLDSDLIWIKADNDGDSHVLFDTQRGINTALSCDTTANESVLANSLISFNTDGFAVGSHPSVNRSNTNYTAWGWGAGGSKITNNSGSIPTQVKTDSKGFSVVTYTGTGVAGTIGHGLTKKPDFAIIKSRDESTNWVVWSNALKAGNNAGFASVTYLNTIASSSSAEFNNTEPDAAVFTLSDNINVNKIGDDYIAYCWHGTPNESVFGSYEAASGVNREILTGFKPDYVMIKHISGNIGNSFTSDWAIFDLETPPSDPNNTIPVGTDAVNYYYRANENTAKRSLRNRSDLPDYGETPYIELTNRGFKFFTNDETVYSHGNIFMYFAFNSNSASASGGAAALLSDAISKQALQ